MCDLRSAAARASLTALTLCLSLPAASTAELSEIVRAAIRLPCQFAPEADLANLAARLPGARPTSYARVGMVGWRMVFDVAGGELTIQFSGQPGRPDQVAMRYLAGPARRPRLFAVADGSCKIQTARQLDYDAYGRPEWLQDLDRQLRPVGKPEPLNPPVPAGNDPPGILVGLVDSGVNYLLPEILTRLARNQNGRILGYDYWDLDERPFDAEPTSDPFHPGRHGTRTASIVLSEAPVAKLVPYRYPRPDMTRMTGLIEGAARDGVRVMNLSLITRDRQQWLAFEDAARTHPEMLFLVAAGNQGRDLERQPAYPAALDLVNMIVVTSATADGRLAPDANFGPRVVQLMVPGEHVVVLDFDGVRRPVSGSSYATARVSALAACLLADQPKWSIAQLKAAVLRYAVPDELGRVAIGFVPNAALGTRGACRRPMTRNHAQR